jgi:hypothetical protein
MLETCRKDGYMREICQEGNITEDLIEFSISSMKTWLEDVSQADGIAEWGGARTIFVGRRLAE